MDYNTLQKYINIFIFPNILEAVLNTTVVDVVVSAFVSKAFNITIMLVFNIYGEKISVVRPKLGDDILTNFSQIDSCVDFLQACVGWFYCAVCKIDAWYYVIYW